MIYVPVHEFLISNGQNEFPRHKVCDVVQYTWHHNYVICRLSRYNSATLLQCFPSHHNEILERAGLRESTDFQSRELNLGVLLKGL